MPWIWQRTTSSEPESTTASSRAFPRPSKTDDGQHATNPGLSTQSTIEVFTAPQTLVSALVLTSAALLSIRFYKRHLRRVPTIFYLKDSHLPPPTTNSTPATSTLRPGPSLFGTVTSVNDPDNFRFYHTPGGRFLLWSSSLRLIPTSKQALKDQTLPIRLAGIDAPELAHWGHPAQPNSSEALQYLKGLVEGKRVRVYPLRTDHYQRVVALAFVSRGWLQGLRESWWEEWPYVWRKDVGLAVIRAGMATVYEAKTGVEFGGEKREIKYRAAETKAKEERRGIWGGSGTVEDISTGIGARIAGWLGWKSQQKTEQGFETPREFKDRMAKTERIKQQTERTKKLG